MKFLSRISIFLISAAIFMSAFVVFADNESAQTPEWPYLDFTIALSDNNNISDADYDAFNSKISDTVAPPFYALTRDYPDLALWIHGFSLGSYYTTKPIYSLSKLEYTLYGYPNYGDPNGMIKQLQDVIDSFTPSGETMYDKLMFIHDYICQVNTYVTEQEGALYANSAYGALVDRKSVCEGYAEAFKLLCDKAEIDCVLVTGMAYPDSNDDKKEPHMWNLVRMDDGKWYAVDVTWDDAGDIAGNYSYFLIGADTVVRGMKFCESHIESYNFSKIEETGNTIPGLQYDLSEAEYNAQNVQNSGVEYVYDGRNYHFNLLNDAQKEIYNKMLAELRQNMPSDPSKTPSIDTPNGEVTTPSETTTEPSQTTPEDTTTEEITTTVDTTTEEETTTPEDTTTEPPQTTPEDTTTETNPIDTTPSDTTEPPVSSTQKETTPPKQDTTKKPDTTVKDTESDTTGKPDTTAVITTSAQKKAPQNPEMQDLYETVTTVVIVSAITSMSAILGIVIIKFAKKYKK